MILSKDNAELEPSRDMVPAPVAETLPPPSYSESIAQSPLLFPRPRATSRDAGIISTHAPSLNTPGVPFVPYVRRDPAFFLSSAAAAAEENTAVTATTPSGANRSPVVPSISMRDSRGRISAAFCIDPKASASDFDFGRKCKACKRHRKRSHSKNTGKDAQRTPHASFRTRRGPISLSLDIGNSHEKCRQVTAEVLSKRGDIDLNIKSKPPTKTLSLNVFSKRGQTIVLLPPNFHGDIHIFTRKYGTFEVMPGLSQFVRSMNSYKRISILSVGEPLAEDMNKETTLDCCHLGTKRGHIIVGLSGVDDMPAKEESFWQKLGCCLRGRT